MRLEPTRRQRHALPNGRLNLPGSTVTGPQTSPATLAGTTMVLDQESGFESGVDWSVSSAGPWDCEAAGACFALTGLTHRSGRP